MPVNRIQLINTFHLLVNCKFQIIKTAQNSENVRGHVISDSHWINTLRSFVAAKGQLYSA